MTEWPAFGPHHESELRAALVRRLALWIPELRAKGGAEDVARAIVAIAARLETEVAQRLVRVPEKTFRGFLHWLGITGRSANAAQVPVVFSLAGGAEPVLAEPPIRLQAIAEGTPVVLEVAEALRLVPARLVAVIGADPARDAFFGPFPGLSPSAAPRPAAIEWRLRSAAPALSTTVQLDPPTAFDADTVLMDAAGNRYRVTGAADGLVSIEPAIGTIAGAASASPEGLAAGARLTRALVFDPFAPTERDRQRHALYLGSRAGLDIRLPAVLELIGGAPLAGCEWHLWGRTETVADPGWIRLEVAGVDGRLFLAKPAAVVEPTRIGGVEARWLRATRPGQATDRPVQLTQLRLLANCTEGRPALPAGFAVPVSATPVEIGLEGIANTAPLVLDRPFFPLGREPRIFDAFHIGSAEAFSKPRAKVNLDFTLGMSFASPLVGAVPNRRPVATTPVIAAAVLNDGRLRRIEVKDDGSLSFLSLVQPVDDGGRPIGLARGPRLAAIAAGAQSLIAATDGRDVWLWRQPDAPNAEADSIGAPGTGQTTNLVMVMLPGESDPSVFAVNDGVAYEHLAQEGTSAWEQRRLPVGIAGQELTVRRLAPIVDADTGRAEVGVIAIAEDGSLFVLESSRWRAVDGARADPAVQPLAVRTAEGDTVIVIRAAADSVSPGDATPAPLVAFRLDDPAAAVRLARTPLIGSSLAHAARKDGAFAIVFATADPGGATRPAAWLPFTDPPVFTCGDPGGAFGVLADAPLRIRDDFWLFPLQQGSVGHGDPAVDDILLVAPQLASRYAIVAGAQTWNNEKNLIVDLTPDQPDKQIASVTSVRPLPDGGTAFRLDRLGRLDDGPVAIHRGLHPARNGELAGDELVLEQGDGSTAAGSLIAITWKDGARIATVDRIEMDGGGGRVARLVADPAVTPHDGDVSYRNVEPAKRLQARLRPALACPDEPWQLTDKSLARVSLPAVDGLPAQDRLRVLYRLDRPDRRLILDTSRFPQQQKLGYVVVAPFLALVVATPPLPRNPELAWEYWDGAGWWQIPDLVDETANLVRSGSVRFRVPANLQPTSVLGRDNHWIRTRLTQGDYGAETVSLVPDANDPPIQTVVRDRSNIHPPYVAELKISYSVCCPVGFERVLTEDGGATRDQTAANDAPNATVEAFTPLATQLAPATLRGGEAPVDPVGDADAGDCCIGVGEANGGGETGTAVERDPALYLGFAPNLASGPITLLFLLVDGNHGDAFPLRVEGFIDGAYRPLTSDDGTRGLSESGILTLYLPQPLQEASFFGRALHWLRLRPRPGFDAVAWQPRIRGVHLNAGWAQAAETHAAELLGSSDGSPDLTTSLARPPVIAGSLDLRVRESLADAAIQALRAGDATAVRDEVNGWPGPWVRWHAGDPANAGPDDRVYSLDAATGRIRFGDGRRGRIPPIGRDNLLAAQYQTGGGAAANDVLAWTPITLVSPLAGVEATFAPEAAAGGADPQDAATALRFAAFNLACRDRAVTRVDLEHLALQSSPAVAQARALSAGGRLRLVVAMQGLEPLPSNAQRRALARFLAARTTPAIAANLRVVAPRLVSLRLRLALVITDLAAAGVVARDLGDRLTRLLDPASGGHDGGGWRFGETLTDTDLAVVLADLPHVLDLAAPAVIERVDGHPGALAADQLVRLAPSSIDLRFSVPTSEVIG